MKAKKSLGQHFLKSDKALKSIVSAGEVSADDLVLEIGPGKGALTDWLLDSAGKVIAVEKDDELFANLKENYLDDKLELVHADILEYEPPKEPYKLIANIPYNITGAILEKFLSADNQPQLMVLLVQKEVAERIVERDGKGSVLSISVRAYGNPRYVELVKAGSFVPAPKVDSAIIAINAISKGFFDGFSEETFFKMLKAGFNSKRKKLSSNLAKIYPKIEVLEAIQALDLDGNIRAENLSLGDWKKLAQRLCIRAK